MVSKDIVKWYDTRAYSHSCLLCFSVCLVPVLKGATLFSSDLVKHLTIPYELDYMQVHSYGAGTHSSGTVTMDSDITLDIKGRHVLLIEDLMDSGITLEWTVKHLESK